MRLLSLAALTCGLWAAEPRISKGFNHFYNLEFDASVAAFREEIRLAPSDPNTYNHLAQALLFHAMHEAGALESEMVSGNNPYLARVRIEPPDADQKSFDNAIAKAMELSQARLNTNPRDAEALYSLGAAHSLRSNYNFLVRKLWRDSLREFTQARRLHAQALQIQPDMIDAQLVEGVHDYIVGSLPWSWKMLGFLIGFRGDREGGLRTVERVAAQGKRANIDAMTLLSVVYRRERHAERAVELLTKLIAMFPRNYLYRLELVQMYGDLGKKDEGLAVLKTMLELKSSGAAFQSVPPGKIYYSRGNLLFWYREYGAAIADLRRVTATGVDSGVNTLANAWLRTGQCQDMLGKRAEAVDAYHNAIEAAPDSDAAREARKYVSRPYRR